MENSLSDKGGANPPEQLLKHQEDTTPAVENQPSVLAAGAVPPAQDAAPKKPPQRTPGLKLFDVLLYPLLTNVGVFAVSVGATYLTARGGDRDASGKLIYGKVGEFFQKRGQWLMEKFKSTGMSHEQADMSKMVFFSFVDGSLMAPVVKTFEDHRENIACAIDTQLGTKPEDMSVYDAEPKQSWTSVLGGRALTAAIVVPTAVALDKTGLNNTLFNKPGLRMGNWLAAKPATKQVLGNLDVKELSRVSFFEAFYTSVCTAGLYFTSRGIARNSEDPKKAHHHAPVSPCIADLKETAVPTESLDAKHQQDIGKKPASYCERYRAESERASHTVGL